MKPLRAAWLLVAFVFLFYFVATRWTTAIELTRSLAPWQPALALVLLVAGKLIYAEVVRLTLKAVKADGGYFGAFHAYSLSQVAKYIPGSIWQFVGRFEIYRSYGVRPGQAVELLLLENALMLGTALLVGAGAAVLIGAPLLALLPPLAQWAILAVAVGAAVAALALTPRLGRRAIELTGILWRGHILVLRLAALFLAMWLLLGLSAYTLFAMEPGFSPFFLISLFAFSYVVGFAAIFAPAGIGVREATFTIGLLGIVAPETALLLVVGHRLLYVLADLLCAAVAGWLGIALIGSHALKAKDPGGPRPGQ